MTLSRFLRDYLYIPLGGNRHGAARRHMNLMATMLLGGLWHGAGWTFVLWGGLHGLYLVANHGWRQVVPKRVAWTAAYRHAAWLLTFLAIVVAWVPFRAPTITGAMHILEGMAGMNGTALPAVLGARLGEWRAALEDMGVEFALGGGASFIAAWAWIVALLLVARLAPNTQEIMARYEPALEVGAERATRHLAWRPTPGWAVATAVVAVGGTLALTRVSEFLYFQF